MQVDVYNHKGEVVGKVELSDDVFSIEPNEYAMHQTVVAYLAHQRQGTHKTKTRAEVSGGGKKPWKQKGRGTARAGSTRSPLWVGGGTVHGPVPHKYNLNIPVKVKRLAKKSALSLRLTENSIKVVNEITLTEIKTKSIAELLKNLNLDLQSTLILTPDLDKSIYLSARNIPKVDVFPADKISAYDILKHKNLVILQDAISKIEETLK
jgi:large subunit ribosomal protein L4